MKDARNFHLHHSQGGAAITVRITSRAKKNEIAEILNDGTVNVHLAAGQADVNQALVQYLADVLKIQPNQLEVVAGGTGRDKLVTILNLDAETVQERILSHLS